MSTTNDELGALAAQAEGLEADAAAATAAPGAGGEQAPAVPVQTNAQLLAGVFELGRETFCVVSGLQSPRHVLDGPTVQQLGEVWGAVADKRGWDLSRLMGDYAAEFAAVACTITIGMKLNKAVAAELATREPKEKGERVIEPAPQPVAA